MIKAFREKPPQLEAIEVTDVLDQMPEIATLVGAEQVDVKMVGGERIGNFSVMSSDGAQLVAHQVKDGQVVTLANGAVTVLDSEDFHSKYEAIQ